MKDTYSFRPPAKPTVSDELLDRLLSSVPYPDDDYDVENPCLPWRRTPWTATRHRMDALYGRDFNAANVSAETLEAIDDLFGSINLDTVSQTIHFARASAITSQRGDGEFVTHGRMLTRWGGIRTLAIHGHQNGLVDASTQQLLADYFAGPASRFEALDSRLPPYDRLGHQDVLIGTGSERVFRDIEAFLRDPVEPPPLSTSNFVPPTLDLPYVGPCLTVSRLTRGSVEIACRSDPNQGAATLLLIPVSCGEGGFEIAVGVDVVEASATGVHDWIGCTPDLKARVDGWLALLAYEFRDSTARRSPGHAREIPHDRFDSTWRLRLRLTSLPLSGQSHDTLLSSPQIDRGKAAEAWLNEHKPLARRAFVSRDDVRRAQQGAAAGCSGFRPLYFALASCQYPAGLVDSPVAHDSLRRLALLAEPSSVPIDLALFTGDQIYADATAGLFDPVRRDERFDRPWVKALRVPPLRDIARSVPIRMMIDDHELAENWHPLPCPVGDWRPDDLSARVATRIDGYNAWASQVARLPVQPRLGVVRYGPRNRRIPVLDDMPTADQCFTVNGHPFFLLDTRLGRSARGSLVDPAEQQLVRDVQFRRLACWLFLNRRRLKFVATPAVLLPRRRATRLDASAAAESDAWDGYPKTMATLFEFMVTRHIVRTVFLSGDEHHSFASIATLRRGDRTVPVVSVHGSALYAPFPFANGRPGELQLEEKFHSGQVEVDVKGTWLAPRGDGFTMVRVISPTEIRIEFHISGQPVMTHAIDVDHPQLPSP